MNFTGYYPRPRILLGRYGVVGVWSVCGHGFVVMTIER